MGKDPLAVLEALGEIASDLGALDRLGHRLGQLSLWQPAEVLRQQAAEGRRLIGGIQERMDHHLVVVLVGPSGAGKSTLLNALAGVDDLSPTGTRRPTTRAPLILSGDPAVAHRLADRLKRDDVQVDIGPGVAGLEHLILVDTPDTDSMALAAHRRMVLALVAHADVLVCVFDAQNPRRRDHADFMAPLVRRFHGASLVAVMNKVDRLDAAELSEAIGPEFVAYLDKAWETRPEVVLLVSARNHLQNPQWDPQAGPRHDMDQFRQLQDLIGTAFGSAGFGRDRRVANARRIRDYLINQAVGEARKDRAALAQAREKMTVAAREAMQQALTGLRQDNRRQFLGVHVRLYQALAQRWLGPVGWLVAIWSRLIVFGSGLTALVRFGNPIHQIWGVISSLRRFKESRDALKALMADARVDQALQAFDRTLLVHWPDIAERMIAGRFDPGVRRPERAETRQVSRDLDTLWADRLDAQIEASAKALSHSGLQLLFNLPGLALMGYVGWLTVQRFFSGDYLTTDFFLHALLTIAIVLLLSFFVLQALVRLATGGSRIQRRAFAQLEQAVAAQPFTLSGAMATQIEGVIALAQDDGATDDSET